MTAKTVIYGIPIVSGFLTIFDLNLLRFLWQVAFAFAGVSVLMVLSLAYRRAVENQLMEQRLEIRQVFRNQLSNMIDRKILPHPSNRPEIPPDSLGAFVEACLGFFRNLSGPDQSHLARILGIWNMEPALKNIIETGERGYKIRALSLLSFLETDTSIEMLELALADPDPYIQLSAIRCLARRGSLNSLGKILEALRKLNWDNALPIADAFQRFDQRIIPDLEDVVETADNPILRLAALQALVLLKPIQTDLDLSNCMQDSNPEIRAAAVALSEFVTCRSGQDIIPIGISDQSPIVRIRAIKALLSHQRLDLLSRLHKCLEDPEWWVRYWAGHAIYNLGHSGVEILKCVGRQDSGTGDFARAALAEFQAA